MREAVVNAIAHRDVTIDSMKAGGSHVLQNPTIYNLLVKMKMVTDMGSGVRRIIRSISIREAMNKEAGLNVTESEVIVTLP